MERLDSITICNYTKASVGHLEDKQAQRIRDLEADQNAEN
jgi:hypothetical protein